ncbi:ankyrin repeat domain-containing protein [Leptobacterium flavescens]|uniref:Ankyrin repeat domain-containing protein n=1 Tax=Leptobacterium flavescens TaxID=472055 RepID=A0A6P0UH75_9FLAO|nr:ankyrin repeat domain-containing protein [Leptobacterium flavescens]NER12615.1 ankyrin repeat domain-containing protein [Leptobacterium flavescens]
MKRLYYLIALAICFVSVKAGAQNVFLSRDYWKANPSVSQVEKDIAAGNDPSELNSNAFDAVSWALIEKTDNVTVKYLLEQKGNGVNKRTHDGRTYIFWAAYRNNLEMMKYLVSKGAKTGLIDSHGYSLLNFTAVTGQLNTALYNFCISHGSDPKTETNHDGANALLLLAPFLKDDSLIDYFVTKGIDLHSKDNNGNGIFNYAAKKGNTELLDLLVKKGVDYRSLTKEGANAFIFASQGTRNSANTLETYKYLEALGLEPNITTDKGFTPLHALAYRNKDLKIFAYFIDKGVDVNQPDMNGNTAFLNAASRNDLKSISFLSEYITDINTKNKEGQTALMLALRRNTAEVAQFMLKKGADIKAKDTEGNSLAYYLLNSFNERNTKPFEQKLKMLQDAGLDFTEAQSKGNTLWHLAVKENNMALLKEVAQFNIPINLKNKEGITPLHLAAMKATDTEILKFLLEKGANKKLKTDFDETVLDLARENELLQKQNVELNFLR